MHVITLYLYVDISFIVNIMIKDLGGICDVKDNHGYG